MVYQARKLEDPIIAEVAASTDKNGRGKLLDAMERSTITSNLREVKELLALLGVASQRDIHPEQITLVYNQRMDTLSIGIKIEGQPGR